MNMTNRPLDLIFFLCFLFFYLKVYLNMSRFSTVCVKVGDKNKVFFRVYSRLVESGAIKIVLSHILLK